MPYIKLEQLLKSIMGPWGVQVPICVRLDLIIYIELTSLVKIVNIFDDRHERVINQRWEDIVSIKHDDENFEEANRRIEVVNTAFSVSFDFLSHMGIISFINCVVVGKSVT